MLLILLLLTNLFELVIILVFGVPSILLPLSVALQPAVTHIVLVRSKLTTLAILALISSVSVSALSRAQLIVSWGHGVLGPRAIGNVDGELKDEPVLL